MRLFDDIERTFSERKPANWSCYEYYNRSALPVASVFRKTWELFLGNFPESHKADLIGRFKSPDVKQHLGAAFELFLFAFFAKQDFQVTVHPQCNNQSDDTPDFLISKPGEGSFILEASCVFPDVELHGFDRVVDELRRAINCEVQSKQIQIFIRFKGSVKKQPSIKRIVDSIKQYVSVWDRELIDDLHCELPQKITSKADDLILEIKPSRGSTGGAIMPCWAPHEARLSRTHVAIQNKLKEKAKKDYKGWQYPLVIAINVVEQMPLDEDDVLAALFGIEKIRVDRNTGTVVETFRDRKAFWQWNWAPRNTRIPTVIFFHNLGTLDLDGSAPWIYYNPYIDQPMVLSDNTYLTRFIPNKKTESYEKVEGQTYFDLMGLWRGWPTPQSA